MEKGIGSSQIFCLSWVKQGAAKSDPDMVMLSAEELKELREVKQELKEETNDVNEEVSTEEDGNADDDLDEYDLGNYDEDEGDYEGIDNMYVYPNNEDDPYILKGDEEESLDSDEELEKSSMTVKPEDNLLICARCSQNTSVLEVFVYNHENKDFFVHHDIPLLETPLCMQWIGFDPGADDRETGNLVALGNFNSTIDIWDLNVLNTLEPVFTIGKDCNKNLKKKPRRRNFVHRDAILDLSWSENVNDCLASASADEIVALWDLEMGVATGVFKDHSSKVQSVEWQPRSNANLCSGSFDGKIYVLDKTTNTSTAQWKVDGEVERITWNRGNNHYFAASTDKGFVYYMDWRKPGSNIFKWKAHKEAVPSLSVFASFSKCFLSTASSDGFVKVWDLEYTDAKTPKLVHEKDIKIGMVHCLQPNPDEELVVACGGQKDAVRLWNLAQTRDISSYLGISSPSEGFDTLKPEGGGDDHDNNVLKYVAGDDYIKPSKIEMSSAKSNGGKKRKKKKKSALKDIKSS